MDFATLDLTPGADVGAEMEVLHPVTREPTGAFIDLFGSDSTQFRAWRKSQVRTGKTESDGAVMAKLIRGWKGITWEGKALEFSHANAVMVLEKLTWLADDIALFATNRANFFKVPPTD